MQKDGEKTESYQFFHLFPIHHAIYLCSSVCSRGGYATRHSKPKHKTVTRDGGYYNVYTDAVVKTKKMKTKGVCWFISCVISHGSGLYPPSSSERPMTL